MTGWIQRTFWEISDDCCAAIAERLRPGMRTLETGSGRSTELFERMGCQHVALEHDPRRGARSRSVVMAPLTGDPPWYDWVPPHACDLILIDGPAWWIGRGGVMRVLPYLLHDHTVVVIDDTHRAAERRLAERIAADYGMRAEYHARRALGVKRGFGVLTPTQGC